jgi:hypothetical protein
MALSSDDVSAAAGPAATDAIDAAITASESTVGVADIVVAEMTGSVVLTAAGVAVPAMVQAVRAIDVTIARMAAGRRAVMTRFPSSPLGGWS